MFDAKNSMVEKNIRTRSGTVVYWLSNNWDSSKKTIFFLHGLAADHSMFREQLSAFSEDYNIVLWDAPMHSKSRPFNDFSCEKAAIIINKIFELNSIEKAVFIGQSVGSLLTQAVIKRFPNIVSAFVSISGIPYGKDYYSETDIKKFGQLGKIAAFYPLNSMKKAVAKQMTATKKAYDDMYAMLSSYDKKELCGILSGFYNEFLRDNCDLELSCPILLIVGKEDRLNKVKIYNKLWAKRLGCEPVVILGAGHNANVDMPERVNIEIKAFLEEIY